MSMILNKEFINQAEVLKPVAQILSIKDNKFFAVTGSSVLETHCNKLIELIDDPANKDQYNKTESAYSKETVFKIPYPEMAVTDKIVHSVIYSELAIAVNIVAELTFGINSEQYNKLITDPEELAKVSLLNQDDSIPFIKFVKDKNDYQSLFYLLNTYGVKTESKKKEKETDKVFNTVKKLEAIGEINIRKNNESKYVNYSLNSVCTLSSMLFKALEESYFINLAIGLSLSGTCKRK